MKLLGIGSRINHSEYGKGVVTNVTSLHYSFILMRILLKTCLVVLYYF